MFNSDHRLGIEIEAGMSCSETRLADALRTEGVPATWEYRRFSPSGEEWLVKYDGSIHGGWELVSPILTLDAVRAQMPAVQRALHDCGARAKRTCGVHVHLSGFDQSTDALEKLAKRWCNYEDTMDLMQPPSRRADHNTYCRSNLRQFGAWNATPEVRALAAWEAISEAASNGMPYLIETVSPSRYRKLNFEALDRHGTVEFRHHCATISATKVIRYCEFLSRFTDLAIGQDRLYKRPLVEETAAERFRKMMRGMPMRVVRFYQSRITTLNGGTFPGAPTPTP